MRIIYMYIYYIIIIVFRIGSTVRYFIRKSPLLVSLRRLRVERLVDRAKDHLATRAQVSHVVHDLLRHCDERKRRLTRACQLGSDRDQLVGDSPRVDVADHVVLDNSVREREGRFSHRLHLHKVVTRVENG